MAENKRKAPGTPYKRAKLTDTYDVIIIGSGMGALTAGALFAKYYDKKVLILEQHYVAGGMTHVFKRQGYEWPTGLHYVGVTAVEFTNNLTEGALGWTSLPDAYDRVFIDGKAYDFLKGRKAFIDQMTSYFPNDVVAIRQYVAALENANTAKFDYFGSRALPGLIDKVAGNYFRRRLASMFDISTRDALRRITQNPLLQGVLAGQWGNYGLPPAQTPFGVHCVVSGSYLDGGFYPEGGPRAIAEVHVPIIEAAGGAVVVAAEVTQIVVKNSAACGVMMSDGRVFEAPCVISDVGAFNTFERLIPEKERTPEMNLRTPGMQPSIGCLAVYLGLKKERLPSFANCGNMFIGIGPDHDATVASVWSDPNAEVAVFVGSSSEKDAQFRAEHPGRSTIEAAISVPWSWFERWENTRWGHRGAEYEALKEHFKDLILKRIAPYVPETASDVEICEISTPLSMRHFSSYANGEMYGIRSTRERFFAKALHPRTPVKGLFLTGQDVCISGIEGAMFGGAVTTSNIIGTNLVKRIMNAKVPTPKRRVGGASM